MKYLVVYASAYGNTARIAGAVRAGLGPDAEARAADAVTPAEAAAADLLVVGSPTQGGRPTKGMLDWLAALRPARPGARAATFDTRLAFTQVGFAMSLLIKLVGFAAPRISATLRAGGYSMVGEPQGFIVTGKEGPLADGELARAEAWGKTLARPLAATGASA